MFTMQFLQSQIFLSEFKSNLLETQLCTKSKPGVKNLKTFHHAVSLSSVVFKALFSVIYVQHAFHSEGSRRDDLQPKAYIGRQVGGRHRKTEGEEFIRGK